MRHWEMLHLKIKFFKGTAVVIYYQNDGKIVFIIFMNNIDNILERKKTWK